MTPLSAASSLPLTGILPPDVASQQKIAKSCEEFEAALWRQMLEKAMQPLLAPPTGGAPMPGSDVYGYFITDKLAQGMSGHPNSFSSLLQAQLAGKPSVS